MKPNARKSNAGVVKSGTKNSKQPASDTKSAKSKSSESIIPQAKLLRLFQIIAVLKSGHWTIQQLAERFDTSPRTIYRYMNLLEAVDFLVEKDFENRYFIITSDDDPTQAVFSVEETRLMKKLIATGTNDNPLKNLLLKKLSLNSEIDSMPRLFLKQRIGKLVEEIAEAIRTKKQIVLTNYHSANSNDIRDRLVEPIHFGDNYQSVVALDTGDQVCKQFKLDRIASVVIATSGYQFEALHKKNQSDIFGMSGDSETRITLQLTLRAYLLLREEFPLAIPFITQIDDGYVFNGPVSSFEGPSRFVLGLIDEIAVVGPDSLRDFIDDKIRQRKS
ncbi:WYL domain-containing protein [Chryseolinea sp. T2]|uniref:helix-turn-helix transcriptional regulator n=1 Tax=Chryseolinea sp. T2 TaxID=3129255 RepID=UPI003077C979